MREISIICWDFFILRILFSARILRLHVFVEFYGASKFIQKKAPYRPDKNGQYEADNGSSARNMSCLWDKHG